MSPLCIPVFLARALNLFYYLVDFDSWMTLRICSHGNLIHHVHFIVIVYLFILNLTYFFVTICESSYLINYLTILIHDRIYKIQSQHLKKVASI